MGRQKETEQPFQGHTPITLTTPGFEDLDLGHRLVNPKRIDLTGPCDDTQEPEEQGDQESWNKDDSWEAWAKGAEGWLLNKYRVNIAPK